MSKYSFFIFLCVCAVTAIGCAAAQDVGKVTWQVAKVSGKVAWETTKVVGKGAKTTVNIIRGKTIVPIYRQGNSMFVTVTLNRKMTIPLLLDTGAANTQISLALAKELGINLNKGRAVVCQIADGRKIQALQVYLSEVKVGRATVRNVEAVVLLDYTPKGYEGLLGMSFLNHFIFQIDTQKQELILQNRVN